MSEKHYTDIAKEQYGQLFDAVTALLFEVDFMSINFEFNDWEYDLEAATIIPRLHKANTVQDVEVIVREVFEYFFGC